MYTGVLNLPKAEVAALFADEAGSAGEAEVGDAYDVYAWESLEWALGDKKEQWQIFCDITMELLAHLLSVFFHDVGSLAAW